MRTIVDSSPTHAGPPGRVGNSRVSAHAPEEVADPIRLVSDDGEPHEPEAVVPTRVTQWWARLLSAMFIVMVCTPLLLLSQGVRPDHIEGRNPTPMPAAADILTGSQEALTALQLWYRDRLPGLDLAVAADARLDLSVFGRSPNPEVMLGREGWLFLKDVVELPCLTDAQVAGIDAIVERLQGAAHRGGRRLVLLLPPDKAAVHPDLLPANTVSCSRANAEALAQGLAGQDVMVPLDVLDARAERGDSTYFDDDTHWTDEASLEVSDDLLDLLGADTSTGEFEIASTRSVPLNLKKMQGLPGRRDDDCWQTVRPGVTVEGRAEDCVFDITGPITTEATTAGEVDLLPSATLIFDSFGQRNLEVLPAWFTRLHAIYKPTIQDLSVGDEVRDSEIVVLEIGQALLGEVLGDEAFLAELTDALASPRSP